MQFIQIHTNFSDSMSCNIFQTWSLTYNLRTQTDFRKSSPSTSQYGLSSSRGLGSIVSDMVLLKIKNLKSIESFKEKIREWRPIKDSMDGAISFAKWLMCGLLNINCFRDSRKTKFMKSSFTFISLDLSIVSLSISYKVKNL